jgi:hypothetical protein
MKNIKEVFLNFKIDSLYVLEIINSRLVGRRMNLIIFKQY